MLISVSDNDMLNHCVCQAPIHIDPNPPDQQILNSIWNAFFLEKWQCKEGWKPRVPLNNLTRLAQHEYQT